MTDFPLPPEIASAVETLNEARLCLHNLLEDGDATDRQQAERCILRLSDAIPALRAYRPAPVDMREAMEKASEQISTLRKKFGAPGDYGYETPAGELRETSDWLTKALRPLLRGLPQWREDE